tara:strand:- start:10782 stop:12011 length:1230 start_codon:yes stop_codon:yes gene_type:complete
MKILVLTGDSKTLVYHRGELLKRLAEQGLEVVSAATGDSEFVRNFLAKIGGRFIPLGLCRTGMNPLKDLASFFEIFQMLRREEPDYLFCYGIKSVIYGTIGAKLSGVPRTFALIPGLGYTFSPDGTFKQRIAGLAARVMYSIALRGVDKVFLQNSDDEQLLRDARILPKETPSFTTAGSGVSLTDFPCRTLADPEKLSHGTFRFLLISRLLKKKGIAEFAEAAKKVRRKFPNAQFDLVGPFDKSPDGVPLQLVESWQREGILNYHGSTRDVRKFLKRANVFVLPTYYREGVPRSILEALSTGLPIITTDMVGSRETVEITTQCWNQRKGESVVHCGNNGILVPPKDANSLAEAMVFLLESPDVVASMGQESRQLAERRFDVHRVNSDILHEMGFTEPITTSETTLPKAA